MDTHSNIRDLRDHRDEAETGAHDNFRRTETRAKTAPAATAPTTTCGTGWYHDAAIEASRREAIEARCHPVHW